MPRVDLQPPPAPYLEAVQEVTVAPIIVIKARIVKIRFIFVVFRFENKPDVVGMDLKCQKHMFIRKFRGAD
jgi:hypothetical protein